MRKGVFRAARSRLVAWNVTVFALLLILLGVAAYRAFSSTIYDDIDQQLSEREARILDRIPGFQYDAASMFNFYPSLAEQPFRVLVGDSSGFIDYNPTECPTSFPINPPGPGGPPCPPDTYSPISKQGIYSALAKGRDLRTAWFHGAPQRVLTFVVEDPNGKPQLTIQLSRDASGQESALRTLRLLLIFSSLLGIVLAAFGSLFLANRALVPIRQAFARQRQFTADASHELRTPLSLIRANAEMLCRHTDRMALEDAEMVQEIIRESDHLNRLVGDLLTLARSDTETLKLAVKPVDFRSLVDEVHDDIHRIAETKGVDTSLTLDGPVTVPGDETRLRQLLLILLDNALKYTDPGGKVSVSVERENGHARLVVSDTGVGIPAKDLPHIFDRFYRVDRAREHESGGTGLGLAIARWIVQAHHGNIRAESQQGKGTRFQIDLPAE